MKCIICPFFKDLFMRNANFVCKAKVLLVLSLLISSCGGNGSSLTEANPPSSPRPPDESVTYQEFIQESTPSVPQVNVTPTPAPMVLPGNVLFLELEDYAISYDIGDLTIGSDGSVLVFLSSETGLPQAPGSVYTLDVVDWEGRRETLLSITYIGREGFGDARIYVNPIDEESPWILASLEENYRVREYYLFNINTGETWAFQHGCESALVPSIGTDYIAYSCFEDRPTWIFLPLDLIGNLHSITLSGSPDDLCCDPPVISDNDAFFLEDINRIGCLVDFRAWDPVCKEFDFWLGSMSPDGQWIEARIGNDAHPESIGFIDIECFREEGSECVPHLTSFPEEIAPQGFNRYLSDSAWLPDNRGLVYFVHAGTNQETLRAATTEFWLFDLSIGSFEYLNQHQGELFIGEDSHQSQIAPPPWSPDGSSVVVGNYSNEFFLLNVETGELTPLTEGGTLLGAITLP